MAASAAKDFIQEKMLAGTPGLGEILILDVDMAYQKVYWYHKNSEEIRHSRIAFIEDGSAVVTECLGIWNRSI